jgi:hypothetical protein
VQKYVPEALGRCGEHLYLGEKRNPLARGKTNLKSEKRTNEKIAH